MFHCHFPQKIGWMDGERWEHFLESRAGTFSAGFSLLLWGPLAGCYQYFIEVVSIMYVYRTTLSVRLHGISITNFDDDRAKLKPL